jgi:hypothetical protein
MVGIPCFAMHVISIAKQQLDSSTHLLNMFFLSNEKPCQTRAHLSSFVITKEEMFLLLLMFIKSRECRDFVRIISEFLKKY